MSRSMNTREWESFESSVRHFCELREEYRRRKDAGTLGTEVEDRMIQSLNGLEIEIERMKSRNELARARLTANPAAKPAALRKAQ